MPLNLTLMQPYHKLASTAYRLHPHVGSSAMSGIPFNPLEKADADLEKVLASVVYNGDGLVPAIVQDARSKEVLMMAWMSAETLELTLKEGRTVFWSRSRQVVWRKGETSGECQWVREAYYDCDADALLFIVDQQGGGACHAGRYSCFFKCFDGSERSFQNSVA